MHALGVIWYQLLTGDLGMMSVPPDWREQVEERGLNDDLVKLLALCIASKAGKRPASAIALTEQLQDVLPPSAKTETVVRQESEQAKHRQQQEAKVHRQEPDDWAGQLEGTLRAVEQSHAEARRLADEQHDYAAAVQALETVPEHLRDNALYATLIESRDRAAQLEDEVRQAVRRRAWPGCGTK